MLSCCRGTPQRSVNKPKLKRLAVSEQPSRPFKVIEKLLFNNNRPSSSYLFTIPELNTEQKLNSVEKYGRLPEKLQLIELA